MIQVPLSIYRPYTHTLRRLIVGLGVGIILEAGGLLPAFAQTQPKASTATTKASAGRAVEKTGLHFVFDASGSMCGYLRAEDPAKALLIIIKRATALKDSEKNNKVMLLRQSSSTANAARDIVEAPDNFQALADNPATATKAKCAPFDGAEADVGLMFSSRSTTANARSLVLVTDMLLEEKAQISFVDQFRAWGRALGQQPLSSGVVTLSMPFTGRYHSLAEPDPAKRRSGYTLPTHDRPLSLIWLAVGQEDIATVRNLLAELGLMSSVAPANFAYGLQVLPIRTEERTRWFQTGDPLVAASALFGQPKIDIRAPNTDRRPEILRDCVETRIQGNEILVRPRKKCRDEKPFFETVSGLDVILPIKIERGITVAADAPIASMKGANLILSFARNSHPTTDVSLKLSALSSDLTTAKLSKLTLDNDACVVSAGRGASKDLAVTEDSWEKRCAEKLAGKVYRYDAFVQQFASRAKAVLDEQLASIKLNLKVTFER